MDLNISNYSIDELIEMLGIHNEMITLEIVLKKAQQMIEIENANGDSEGTNGHADGPNVKLFIKNAVERIVNHYGWKNSVNLANLEIISSKGFSEREAIYVKDTNIVGGIVNPIDRKTYTRLININTRFRDNYSITNASDLILYLPDVIKKIVSLKMVSIEIPNTYYNISSTLKNNMFAINHYELSGGIINSSRSIIRIQDGYYTPELLEDYLNLSVFGSSPQLDTPLDTSLNRVRANYDGVTRKMLFTLNTDIEPYKTDYLDNSTNCIYRFDVDFSIGNGVEGNIDPKLNIGWMLGYRNEDPYYDFSSNYVFDLSSGKFYSGGTIIQPENAYQFNEGFNGNFNVDMEMGYFLLDLDDGQNHTGQLIMNVMGENALGGNSLAKIQVETSQRNVFNNIDTRAVTICRNDTNEVLRKREYFGPVDIERMRIRLLDEYGRVVDLNGTDYSLTLELEVLYD
jgi:hypothetical protein